VATVGCRAGSHGMGAGASLRPVPMSTVPRPTVPMSTVPRSTVPRSTVTDAMALTPWR